ncbi:formate dehydrogenase accessory sulfurtransferase FdhD [Saccharomonospora xinjiangensis]|uniref:formate dehydrogenase accessory sulfurtransferase FdhD n=1 Tax=Saccharomonospora xinjiangensis TaxID=75294 RepID=UPI00107040C8|nr:formate dehydrogenase accessory sulfurtransferase FdhD [Saccharomonospora xinjiangensis]QBQ59703.1 formate dehydrogenase accessory protein [Saccharomonospora xinjiangensis]
MGRVTVRRPVRTLTPRGQRRRPDTLAVEEPLEIRVSGTPLAVTMRTPGHDVELAHGFLLSEGVIGHREDVVLARYCDGVDDEGRNTYNVLDLTLADDVPMPGVGVRRNFYTTSSCGVCGKAALDAVRLASRFPPSDSGFTIDAELLTTLPDALRRRQRVFAATGGLHGAGLFTSDGALLAVREDVGRHNAVDKILGWALQQNRVPASDLGLLLSGRASFELVQKAAMAGISLVAAVSAPSSLAVALAEDHHMTLVGFLRGQSMNLYTGNGIA